MPTHVQLGDIAVSVVRKDIRNVHLSVHPPTGRVTISAPSHLGLDTIRVFAISRLAWIRQQQRRLVGQERETPRDYINRESHYVWGRRYLLKLVEGDAPPSVELVHRELTLHVRPGTTVAKRQEILDAWYRDQVRAAVVPLLRKWEKLMVVTVAEVFVQRMKTKWGSCNPRRRNIRLNTDLAKKPSDCLEYIVVHEMVHLLEPTHNARFVALMDQFMPKWQSNRQLLNQLPVRHEEWR